MTESRLSRRSALVVAATGVLGACTAPDQSGDEDVPAESPTESEPGDDARTSKGETEAVSDPLDEILTTEPYDAMTVTLVDDGAMRSWDITYLQGDAEILRYRLQGEWDGTAGQADGYQRLEEVRALSGAPSLQGQVVMPRSNWEFAFQLDVDGDKQFVPYHGTATAFQSAPSTVTVDGSSIDVSSHPVGQPVAASAFALEQHVLARHPARGEDDLVKISTTTTWSADGKLAVQGHWTALADVVLGAAYGPMLPFSRDVFDQVGTDITDVLEVDSVAEAKAEGEQVEQTIEIDGASAAHIRSTETGWRAAIRWIRADETLRAEANDGGDSDVFLQLRDDGIAKVYPQVWDQGESVPAGATWEFAAEWAVAPTA